MTILATLKQLFSHQHEAAATPEQPKPELPDFSLRDKMLGRVDYRDFSHDPRPAMTLREIHAQLGSAIERGHGDEPLHIELAYVDGLLCGKAQVQVAEVLNQERSPWHPDEREIALRPHISLIHLQKSSYADYLQQEFAKGRWT